MKVQKKSNYSLAEIYRRVGLLLFDLGGDVFQKYDRFGWSVKDEFKCTNSRSGLTYHFNGVDVRELRKELTTAEGQLGVWLEELLSEEIKQTNKCDTMTNPVAEQNQVKEIGNNQAKMEQI